MRRNRKHQTPNIKHQPNPKFQTPHRHAGKPSFLVFDAWSFFGIWCLVFGVWCLPCLAAPLKIELPPETGVFKPAPGVELANGQCLVCHSVEYVVTQPPAPRTFWATSVKKMREKYGAAVADEQVEPLLDYLTKHYGVETTNHAASAKTVARPITLTPPGTPIS